MATENNVRYIGFGWAWEFRDLNGNWVLCNWAVPFKEWLLQDRQSKPDDGARPIRVQLVPTSKKDRKRYRIDD